MAALSQEAVRQLAKIAAGALDDLKIWQRSDNGPFEDAIVFLFEEQFVRWRSSDPDLTDPIVTEKGWAALKEYASETDEGRRTDAGAGGSASNNGLLG